MLGVNHSLLSQGKIIGVVEIVPVPHGALWPCCSGCLQAFWSLEPFKVVKWSLDRWILHLAHGNNFPKKVTPLRADKVNWNITKYKTQTKDREKETSCFRYGEPNIPYQWCSRTFSNHSGKGKWTSFWGGNFLLFFFPDKSELFSFFQAMGDRTIRWV